MSILSKISCLIFIVSNFLKTVPLRCRIYRFLLSVPTCLYQELFLMFSHVIEKSTWLVIDDNKSAGVKNENTLFMFGEGALAFKDCFMVPAKESVFFR